MIQQPTTYTPAPAAEFNAIKINISGATVGAPSQPQMYPMQPVQQPVVQPVQENAGQVINYTA